VKRRRGEEEKRRRSEEVKWRKGEVEKGLMELLFLIERHNY